MKTVMFVLLSAVTLLLHPHSARSRPSSSPRPIQPEDYFKKIVKLTEDCNASLIKNKFVDDVSSLAEVSGCGDKFFCKVEQILKHNTHVCKANTEADLRRNLNEYHRLMKINCAATLQGWKTEQKMQVSGLLQKVKDCVQKRNWAGSSTNTE